MKICIGMEKAKPLNLLKRLLHALIGLAPTVILIILLCKANIFPLLDE